MMEEVAQEAVNESPSMALASKKKKATKKAKTGEDLIVKTAHELENLGREDAYNLVRELSNEVDFSYFKLGGVLSVIQAQGWFHDDGYDNFKAFVEAEFGIHYRKAMYLVAIYNGLVESGVPWDKVSHLGWTKLKELAHIMTPENVDEWVAAAESMSVIQLQEYIKEKQSGTLETGSEESEAEVEKITTMTFKVHEDQKEIIREAIEKAKLEAGTEFDTVALEAICMNYINSGANVAAKVSVKDVMEKAGWQEVLTIFEQIWPDINVSVEVE